MKKIQVMLCLLGYSVFMHSSDADSKISDQDRQAAAQVAAQIKKLLDKSKDGRLIKELYERQSRFMRGDGVRPGSIEVPPLRLEDIFACLMLAKKK